MPSTSPRTTVAFWHFRCPECGFGDGEMRHRATVDMIFCEVCLEDGQHVPLRRWPVEDSGALADRRS
jgi:hypothetical protein